jgi:hypothetical protein
LPGSRHSISPGSDPLGHLTGIGEIREEIAFATRFGISIDAFVPPLLVRYWGDRSCAPEETTVISAVTRTSALPPTESMQFV